jgi:hypothetical protein
MRKNGLLLMGWLLFCGILSAQNNYSVKVLAVISSGTTYKAYLGDPLPTQFTVGSSVTFSDYSIANNQCGPFTISARCPSCSPATFTFTASTGPGGIPCSLTNTVPITSSEYPNLNNPEMYFYSSGNTKTIPVGLVWVAGTKESSTNGQALFFVGQAGTTEVVVVPQGQAYKTFDDSSDSGTIGWPVNCSAVQGGQGPPYWDLQLATVTVSGTKLNTQTNAFSYAENTAGSETYTLYSSTPGLPSAFTVGNIVALGTNGSWYPSAAQANPNEIRDFEPITKICATCSPSYIQLHLPYASNCALGPALNITSTKADGSYFYIEDENSFNAGQYVYIQGTEEPLINGGVYDIYFSYQLGYFDFANTSYNYSQKSDTGTVQGVPCGPSGGWVYEP